MSNRDHNNQGMVNKICMVTGATAGIGRITAGALAAQGAEVVVVGRNADKAQAVCEQIKAETGNPALDFLLADFSDLDQVRQLAADFKKRYARLDVLVNNAGAFFNRRIRTSYGVEKTLLVNHLAPFLLTNLLLDVLRDSAPARIVNVSSDAHKMGRLDFDDLEMKRGYVGIRAYGRSKMANILFTVELVRRLEGSGVTVNTLHPGHVGTDMWVSVLPVLKPLIQRVVRRIALTPEEGAQNSIYLASAPEVEGVTGKYFVELEAETPTPESVDPELARRLWQVSAQISGLQ